MKSFLINANINFDPNFIISYPPIDANNDDEISIAEAQTVIRLNFYYAQISNFEGIQFFTSIKSIESLFTDFSTFNYPTLVNLEELYFVNTLVGIGPLVNLNFSGNINLKKLTLSSGTTSLDFSNNINLRDVSIYCPNLTSLNLSNLSNLKNLSYFGKMPTINLSDCTGLLTLNCSTGGSANYAVPDENKLTSLELTFQTKLVEINVPGNNLSSLDLSRCLRLETIGISYNKITDLNIDNLKYVKSFYAENNLLTSLNINALFNIQTLYCQNNQLTSLSTKNGIIEEYIYFSGNPDLATVCCDENEIVYMKNQCLQNNNDTAVVNSNCGNSSIRIAMYPNPVRDILHIDSNQNITKIEIFSMNGLMIMSDEIVEDVVNLEQLQSGMYFIKVYTGEEITNMKFIKS